MTTIDPEPFQNLLSDTAADWAEAAVALAPEVMGQDSWDEIDALVYRIR